MSDFAVRRRSRRLRKKLRVDEFQEFGFDVTIELAGAMARDTEELFIDAFLAEVLESKALGYAGWVRGGFIVPVERGTATEQDREDVRKWMEARSEVASIEVGPLRDAWYECEGCDQDDACH
jgi:uncharacterized protein YggL (DUF469 family)